MVEQFWDTLDRFMLPVLALIAADAFGGEGVLVSNASSCGERWPPRPRGSLPKPRKDPRSAVGSNLQQLKKRRCYFWMQFELYKQCAILVDRLNIYIYIYIYLVPALSCKGSEIFASKRRCYNY